jgi:hypothetical protein
MARFGETPFDSLHRDGMTSPTTTGDLSSESRLNRHEIMRPAKGKCFILSNAEPANQSILVLPFFQTTTN